MSDPSVADDQATTTPAGEEFGVAQVVLKPRKAGPFFGRHPWVFDSAISHVEGACNDGDVVDLHGEQRRFIARGIINRHSRLRVRLYTWDEDQPLDESFWRTRLADAITMRQQIGYDDADGAARLVFGEADGLGGLIVDRFGRHLVVQINSQAMAVRAEMMLDLLQEICSPESIIVRTEPAMARAEGMSPLQDRNRGDVPDGPLFFTEHGLRYGIDLVAGQKTGFYLDQRENRLAFANYVSGRRVLDMFCFTGAFGIVASKLGGARAVVSIDSSAKSIALARANAELNGIANIEIHEHDAFDALDQMRAHGERFGAIVLDPPKFARTRKSLHAALQAYHRINRVAVELLEPGGFLSTCSCSGNISREEFLGMLAGVAQKTGRDIQVLQQRGASPDHPVAVTCPEGDYLKCFICRVS